MNLPIDTCENGSCSFAIRGEYDKRVCAKNLGLGGGHFPATSVCVVYQCAERDCVDPHLPQLQGRVVELSRHWVEQNYFDGGHRDMGGMR